MKGDVIIVEKHHYDAAEKIVAGLLTKIKEKSRKYVLSVAGESGSGKSETAKAIAEIFNKKGFSCLIFQQDDYFIYPPKTNDTTRRNDIQWVGPSEVKLDKLDEDIKAVVNGKNEIQKPLVNYNEDKIEEEIIKPGNAKIVIAEGTYTSLLKNVDTRIFINRNRLDTLESRKKRGREPMESFIEEVLKIEHEIISEHKKMANIVISKDYEVEFNN